jgi:hypothetical protein
MEPGHAEIQELVLKALIAYFSFSRRDAVAETYIWPKLSD